MRRFESALYYIVIMLVNAVICPAQRQNKTRYNFGLVLDKHSYCKFRKRPQDAEVYTHMYGKPEAVTSSIFTKLLRSLCLQCWYTCDRPQLRPIQTLVFGVLDYYFENDNNYRSNLSGYPMVNSDPIVDKQRATPLQYLPDLFYLHMYP